MSRPKQNGNCLRVILHADDLGVSEKVNDAIFSLMDEGKITSASILANGPAFYDAARRSHYFPQCSFGAHLNVTEFAPIRSCLALQPLLVASGEFKRPPLPLVLANALRCAILEEWSAQVQRIRQAGVEITHIDSHHHTHTQLHLLPVVKQLCAAYGIRRVRIRQTFAAKPFGSRWRIDNRLYNWRLRHICSCVDQFGPFAAFAATDLRLPAQTTVELMLHPGHRDYTTETDALAQLVNDDFRRTYQCITHRNLN